MLVLLEDVLAEEDLLRVRALLAEMAWGDGRATAGPAAKPVKANRQASNDDPRMDGLQDFVLAALRRHPIFPIAARPRRISRLLFSAYGGGEAYGPHNDDALMGEPPLRTDLAFTLFLADPDTYAGGELTIESAAGSQGVKLPAGCAVLYSADSIHHVAPVTEGERLACVGWVQSTIRDPRRRDILFDLATVRASFGAAPRDALLPLDKAISNLLRLWAEV